MTLFRDAGKTDYDWLASLTFKNNMTHENVFKSMSKMSFLCIFTRVTLAPIGNSWRGRLLPSQSQFATLGLLSFKTRTLCLPALTQVITASGLSGNICTVNWGREPLGDDDWLSHLHWRRSTCREVAMNHKCCSKGNQNNCIAQGVGSWTGLLASLNNTSL